MCLRLTPFLLLATVVVPALSAGDLTARFDLTVNRIEKGGPPLYTEDLLVADAIPRHTRRFTEFSGDVSGRYIGAMALAAQYTGRPVPLLDRVVTRVIACQKPDGHFGDPMSTGGKVTTADMAILWGNGRLLVGLLEFYRASPRADVLAAARKLADFFVGIAPVLNSEAVRAEFNGDKFAVGYICWTHITEGAVELYRITRDERYLQLAKELAARTDRHPNQHSHGFLTSVRGIVALYRVTGERAYLEQAEREWKGVIDSGNLALHGAVPEMFAPAVKRDEGCSEADWLRFSLDLWRATGDRKYLDAAEHTLFNEFSYNQFHTGDFGHHINDANGYGTAFARAWWCCTFHGLRAMVDVFDNVFREQGGAVEYNLPVDGRAPGVRAHSTLERDGTVRLVLSRRIPRLRIRCPEWAESVAVTLGGRKLAARPRDGYIELAAKAGDAITIAYRFRTGIVRDASGSKAAVFRGPWLLAVDEAASPNYFDEPSGENQAMLAPLPAPRPGASSAAAAPFSVPAARLELKYLPGGYPMQPATALLRPIAEHTGAPDGNPVSWWLPVKPEKQRLDATYTPQP
ncbi:MAG TPA: beta-L-arabinofuranosidase domain-containing protein [Bryobacteraceae bacterium]|nr:beta-L-arabinofuranosidase domain-containing protein [Bryobacteraceae bacterium]